MKTTVTELVKSIPERLGLELDLSTPQKAYDFLNDEDFPIFYMSDKSNGLYDYLDTCDVAEWIFKCGYKAMHVFNELFNPETPNKEMQDHYGICENEATIYALIDCGDDIEYLSDVSFYEEEGTEYIAALPMGIVDFKSILKACAQICQETNDYIRIETKAVREIGKGFGYDISSKGEITSFGKVELIDDNGMCFAGELSCFLSLFCCKTFEEMEEICVPYEIETIEQIPIDTNCGRFYLYKNRDRVENLTNIDEAVELVSRYPVLLTYFPKEIQLNKRVTEAFIDANEPYMAEYNRVDAENTVFCGECGWLHLSAVITSETSKLRLNSIIPYEYYTVDICNDVLCSWCENEEIFESLLRSSMRSWCRISDELFEKLDHKKLFSLEPYYIIVLRRYYKEHTEKLDEKTYDKEDLHIRRKYRLSDDVSEDNIITLKTIEKIEKDCPDAIKILSGYLNNTETVALMKSYLLALPKEERNNLIKRNIRLAYPIRNELSNDDEVVNYICEMCECAGDFLSDEIVEIRGLKRTNLDMSKVCEDCDFC